MIKYFTQKDFDRCNPPCRMEDMNLDTLKSLDWARELAGVPFVLSSAARSLAHERSRGRNGTSSHVFIPGEKKSYAADIKFKNNNELMQIVYGLVMAGFKRMGINYNGKFIHADNDPSKADSFFPY